MHDNEYYTNDFYEIINLLSTRLKPICWRIWSKVNFWDFKPYRRIHSILFNCTKRKQKRVNHRLWEWRNVNDRFTWLNRYAGSDVEPVETFWEEVVRSKFRDSPGVMAYGTAIKAADELENDGRAVFVLIIECSNFNQIKFLIWYWQVLHYHCRIRYYGEFIHNSFVNVRFLFNSYWNFFRFFNSQFFSKRFFELFSKYIRFSMDTQLTNQKTGWVIHVFFILFSIRS